MPAGMINIFIKGMFLITQVVDMFMIWGNIPLMTGNAYLLFTNLAQMAKIVNILVRKRQIQSIIDEADEVLRGQETIEGKAIVKSCNRETSLQQLVYFAITLVTLLGWFTSTEKNELPMRAWYPYDTSQFPAHQLTFFHQVLSLLVMASLNIAKDTLVTALVAQFRCRLQLLGLKFETLCRGIDQPAQYMLSGDQERLVSVRLRRCVSRHQAVLVAVAQLQTCFSAPTFAQFTVSTVIICVTAFQLASQIGNTVRMVSMGTYLLNMMYQVFVYCYQGNQLANQSTELGHAAYSWPWYRSGARVRRTLLVVLTSCSRAASLTAGGFTTLSLASFMAIIKASYSLFTVLQQVDE